MVSQVSDNKYHFETELQQAKTRWLNFQETRRIYDGYHNRTIPTELQPELKTIQQGIDYRTPLIEKANGDWQDILTTNPTNFDLHPVSQTSEAKEQGRRILQVTTRGWEYENPQRRWDRARGEGQVRHGVSFARLCYEPPVEPETDGDDAGEQLKDRKKKMRRRRWPFSWKDMDPYGCYYIGDETDEGGPPWFAYEYELPFIKAREEFVKEDNYLDLDSTGSLGWYGQDQALRANTSERASMYGNKWVRVVMIDCEDPDGRECPLDGCDHKQRIIRIYVTNQEGDPQLDDATLFEEYDSPFPGCSFFAIGGRMSLQSRDPAFRFLAMLKTLYVEGQYENHLTTTLMVGMRRDMGNQGLYVDYSRADPRLLPENGELTFDFEALTESDKIGGFPGEIKRAPYALSPHMLPELNLHREAMAAGMPNAHLTGTANTEASNATGTAFLANEAQASLPASTLLAQTDAAILKSRRYEFHAIRFWGLSDPEGAPTVYAAVMTGNNKNVTYMGEQAKAGDVIEITASDLEDFDFDLEITTENETLAQQQARWLMTWDQYSKGVATPEDVIRAAGKRDVVGQMEKLRAAGIRANFAPYQARLDNEYVLTAASRIVGFDLTHLLQTDPAQLDPAQDAGGGGNSMGTNNIVTPPNSQMGRSAQQVAFAAGNPSLGTATGGSGSQ